MSESPTVQALEMIEETPVLPISDPTTKEQLISFAKAAGVLIAFGTVVTVGSDQASKAIINWLDSRRSA